jgi:hypothetical protein
MKYLLHFQNIDFDSTTNYGHQDHLVEKNADPNLTFGQHLMFFQNFDGIDLVFLDSLDCPIK